MARPAYAMTRDVVQAFDLTNYLFAGLLAWVLAQLMERYGASTLTQVTAIACISLSNAWRLTAFYPVQIDLGGHAIMALALWCIIAGRRWHAALACVAAMLGSHAPST